MNSLKRLLYALLLAGCALSYSPEATTSTLTATTKATLPPTTASPQPPSPTAAASPTPTATETPYPWTDETPTMYGICFEAALDASGQVFVLRSAEDHIRFYDLADNSQLCRRPVTRNPFDFADGERVLAGMWSYGIGCNARHDVLEYTIEGDTLKLIIEFITEGDCPYELVRPFWIGVSGVSDVEITVVGETLTPPES